ncbi:MAG TPA: hypothetical protein VM925_08625 [Labilithrix sp.]|nr:hypothetical protein [Labilithrix sp.]
MHRLFSALATVAVTFVAAAGCHRERPPAPGASAPPSAAPLLQRISGFWFVDERGEQRTCARATMIDDDASAGGLPSKGRIQLRQERLQCGSARHSLRYAVEGSALRIDQGLSSIVQRGVTKDELFSCAANDTRAVREEGGIVYVGDAPWFTNENDCKEALAKGASAFRLSGACEGRLLRDVDPKRGLLALLPGPDLAKLETTLRGKPRVFTPSATNTTCDSWELVDAPGRDGVLVRSEKQPTSETTYRMPFRIDHDCQVLEIIGPGATVREDDPPDGGIGLGSVTTASSCISQAPLLEVTDAHVRFGGTYWYFERAACEREGRSKASHKPGSQIDQCEASLGESNKRNP